MNNRPTRNPHKQPTTVVIANEFYGQIGQRPLSYKPARFVTPKLSTMTVEQMKAQAAREARHG